MFSSLFATFLVAFLAQHGLAAVDILGKMSTSVKPCDDFYTFACGNYPNQVKLEEGEPGSTALKEVENAVRLHMKAVLEAPTDPKKSKTSEVYDFVKKYYRGCMNVKAQEKLGLEPFKKMLDSMDGWPVVLGDKWDEKSYDWIDKKVKIYRLLGYQQIFSFNVKVDYKNNSRRILDIDQPFSILPGRNYYLDKQFAPSLEAYRTFLYNTALQLGADATRAKREIDAIVDLDIKVANISTPDEQRRDKGALYNVNTVGELKRRFPKIPFDKWFAALRKNGFDISDEQLVNIPGAPYLEKLHDILSTTDKRTLANYQMIAPVFWGVVTLPLSLKEHYRLYRNVVYGADKLRPTWKECIYLASYAIGWPVAAVYVREYVNASTKAEIESMASRLIDAMNQTITESTWMDKETKTRALAKLAKLDKKIAYPDNIFNDTYVMQDYDGAAMDENDYFTSSVQASRWYFNSDKRLLKESSNRSTWDAPPIFPEMYSMLDRNSIVLSAALLEEPMYFANGPKYVNYARMGSTLGREVSRGYDDSGRQFDEDGKLNMWWSADTLPKFLSATKCLVDQYTINDTISGLMLNGKFELGENLADAGGLKLAYAAFKASQDKTPSPPELSQYTPEQLFFISYAQTYCEVARPEYRASLIATDPHAPSNYRVTIPLRNFAPFSDAFKCPQGSAMNPKDRCVIW